MPAFRLRPVEFDQFVATYSRYLVFQQLLDEVAFFNGRHYPTGSEWTGGVLYPTYLGISFAERLADLPEFVAGVELLAGIEVDVVSGTASLALPGDPPLLGDWIRYRRFDPDRLARTFAAKHGGSWVVSTRLKSGSDPLGGYHVEVRRTRGGAP